MPIFALANVGVGVGVGVGLGSIDLTPGDTPWVLVGVAVALVVGKPVGVVGISWLLVKLGWCRLPPGVSWDDVTLLGLLADMVLRDVYLHRDAGLYRSGPVLRR